LTVNSKPLSSTRWLARGLLLAGLAIATTGSAEVYKWVDEQGRTHYSDQKPADRAATAMDVQVTSYQFPRIDVNTLYPPDRQTSASRAPVILYSTTWCGYCTKARKYFRRHGIPFREYDVETSSRGKKDYARLNGKGVPIILVGKRRLNGFSEGSFERLYNAP